MVTVTIIFLLMMLFYSGSWVRKSASILRAKDRGYSEKNLAAAALVISSGLFSFLTYHTVQLFFTILHAMP